MLRERIGPGALAGATGGIGYAGRQSDTPITPQTPAAWPRVDPASGADSVTVLTTKGPFATKRITLPPGATRPIIEPYGNAAFFGISEAPVSGIDDLAALLDGLGLQVSVHQGLISADELLASAHPPGVVRYRQLHETTIAGETPYGQLAIEYEIVIHWLHYTELPGIVLPYFPQ
jgi:hypothetical protein